VHIFCIYCALRILVPVSLMIIISGLLNKFYNGKGDNEWTEKGYFGFRTE
jgi:hypothetical protein